MNMRGQRNESKETFSTPFGMNSENNSTNVQAKLRYMFVSIADEESAKVMGKISLRHNR